MTAVAVPYVDLEPIVIPMDVDDRETIAILDCVRPSVPYADRGYAISYDDGPHRVTAPT